MAASRYKTRIDAANAAGVTDETLRAWIAGKRSAPINALAMLASFVDVSLDWIVSGDSPMEASKRKVTGTGASPPSVGSEPTVLREGEPPPAFADYIFVPRYDIAASAGPGAFNDVERVLDHMAFKVDFARRTLGADPRNLALITATGESMEPVIREGDLLLIDRTYDRIEHDGIYAVVIEGTLMVKRVQKDSERLVRVLSANPGYPERVYEGEAAQRMIVAGRVRWIGRMI